MDANFIDKVKEAQHNIKIETEDWYDGGIFNITITNPFGTVVFQKSVKNSERDMDYGFSDFIKEISEEFKL